MCVLKRSFAKDVYKRQILTHYFRDLGTITFVSITIGTSLLFIILTIVSYKKPEGYLQ